jgi:nucleoid DNA-binding protein
MPTITKKEIVDQIADKMDIPQSTVKAIVQCFFDKITTELSMNNRLEFRDFGVFEVKKQAPRTAQNPKTLEPVKVPAKRAVRFKMGHIMKQKLNG